MEPIITKKCKTCKRTFSVDNFYVMKNRRNTDTVLYYPHCKACAVDKASSYYQDTEKRRSRERYKENPEYHLEKTRKYFRAHPLKRLLTGAKNRSRIRGIQFDIREEDITIPTHCPYLGFELSQEVLNGNGKAITTLNSISLDRIDPTKGYVKGNVQVISMLANRMKNNATKEQLIIFAKNVLKMYENTSV